MGSHSESISRNQHVPLGRVGVPVSCVGKVCGFAIVGGTVPAKFAAHSVRTCETAVTGLGRLGTEVLGALKLNALVRSPTAARRHALKLGTSAPNLVSKNLNMDV